METTPETITHIKIGDTVYPLDALYVNGNPASEIGELVSSIDSNSTDSQYPSTKCIYDIVYGYNGGGDEEEEETNVYLSQPLTIKCLSSTGDFSVDIYNNNIEYSTDNGTTWDYLSSQVFSLNQNDTVMFRGDIDESHYHLMQISSTSFSGNFEVYGNIMSLIDSTNFSTADDLTEYSNCFEEIFKNFVGLVNANNLILPATTLEQYCYRAMFEGCINLLTSPVLPATTLVNYCYERMFCNCQSLTSITCLATDISSYGCTDSWIIGVQNESGYFYKNKNMSDWTIDSFDNGVPYGWHIDDYIESYKSEPLTFICVGNEYSSGSISFNEQIQNGVLEYKINNNTWQEYNGTINVVVGDHISFRHTGNTLCNQYTNMGFSLSGENFNVYGNIMSLINGTNFESLTSLPNQYVFKNLFNGCYNLINAQNLILPATTLTTGCYSGMFNSCAYLTTAPKLPATTLAEYCYDSMFMNCSELISAPKLPATTLAEYCYMDMFCYCSNLTTAPELPATTLVNCCYTYMFSYCSNIDYIKCLATGSNTDIYNCTSMWLYSVSSTGTFVKNSSMSSWTTGDDGIPSGWTIENDAS